jgi:chromosomal replication initiation ATPase DnaA
LPVQAFTTNQIECPRCKKNAFALFKEKFRYICFCIDSKCLSLDSEAGKAARREKKQRETERNSKGLETTGAEKEHLGRIYHNAVLSKWIGNETNHKLISDWLTNKKPFLVLLGAPGTGKTYLAAAILNYLFDEKKEIAYTTHRRFIEEIHHAIQSDRTQHSVIAKYHDKTYLILDDLGSATCTDWQQEMLLELIDRRYAAKMKTIFTSNLSKELLKSKLGERTSSRLLDINNEILEFWSTDRRTDPTFDQNAWYNRD